jgi:pimeloyl-ACP methyl ester carboxylesterase
MGRSTALGQEKRVRLPQGEVRYFERGSGEPVVFVHGLLVNAELWRSVVPGVAEAGFRCLAPDWPLGSHETPMAAGADLTPPGQAKLIADFLEQLDLREVTLVANDTGGALTQIVMASHPDRVARVVLTPSDCFEFFFPPMFRFLPPLARVPGAMLLLAAALRPRIARRLPMTFGLLAKRPIAPETMAAYLDPAWRSAGIRRDLRKFLVGVHRRHTMTAARGLRDFAKPVLLAWASEDRLFRISLAHRLADVLPRATVVEIRDSYTFVPEDQPAELVKHIIGFAGGVAD